jgi:hypothetical protein
MKLEIDKKLTRIEIIDHRKPTNKIRVLSVYKSKVELDLQDNGQTLKIFINEKGRK